MTEYQTALERARQRFAVPELPIEKILDLRDRRQRNRRIAAGAVALALVALVLGGWIGAVNLDRSTPADEDVTPTPTPRVIESRRLPNEPGTWSTETSFGTWTWTRIDGDQRSLPFGPPFFMDGVYWMANETGPNRSEDGINWTEAPLPEALRGGDAYAFAVGDGLFAEVHRGGTTSWYRRDGADWVGLAFPAQTLPSVPGMRWCCASADPTPDGLATDGDTTLAIVPVTGSIDWDIAYGGRFGVALIGDHDLTMFEGTTSVGNLDVLFIPGDPGAVEFRDRDSGELVLRVEATDPAVPLREINGDVSIDWRLAVDSGDGFRAVEAPWQGLYLDSLDIAPGAGGFVAVGVDRPEWFQRDDAVGVVRPASFEPETGSKVFAWRSVDGVAWEELPTPDIGPDAWYLLLAGDGERVVMALQTFTPTGVTVWTSTDGIGWTQTSSLGDVGLDRLSAEGPGFVLISNPFSASGWSYQVWLSGDGVSWEPVDLTVDAGRAADTVEVCDRGGGGYGSWWVGDTNFLTAGCSEEGPRILWVGRLSGT
jgi:hypothetical protein